MGHLRHWTNWSVLGLLCAVLPAQARTMYVTDTLNIAVRAQKNIAGRNIVRMLPSGTALEVLDTDSTWARVRLADGRQGYVELQQLIEREPYQVTAERLHKETEPQRERVQTLTQQLAALREEHQRLQKSSGSQETQLAEISKNYERLRQDTTQVVQLQTEHTALQQAHRTLQQEHAALRAAHASLQQSSKLLWFLCGAGVVFAGWFLGMTGERWRGRSRRQGGYSYTLPS